MFHTVPLDLGANKSEIEELLSADVTHSDWFYEVMCFYGFFELYSAAFGKTVPEGESRMFLFLFHLSFLFP